MEKVLYLAHHGFGDVIMQIPTLHYLTQKFQPENIYLTLGAEFIREFIHEQFHIPKENLFLFSSRKNSFIDNIKFICRLRKKRFDYFILAPTINEKLSRLIYYFIHARNMIAPAKHYPLCFKHKVLRNLECVQYFENINQKQIKELADKYYFLNILPINTLKLELPKHYLVIHPGSENNLIFKRYPAENYIKLCSALLKKYPSLFIYLTGIENEIKLTEYITSSVNNKRLINLCGQLSITQLTELLKNAEAMISADCGPAHLASIIGTHCITLFGPTDETYTGPFTNCTIIKEKPLSLCAPCYPDTSKTCRVSCMRNINETDIIEQVNKVLSHETH